MPALGRLTCAALMAASAFAAEVAAQNPPSLNVSPAQATLLVGETRAFRAVGKDGRLRHNVRWSISQEQAADLTLNGDEAVVHAREASSSVVLTAYADGDAAHATLEIRAGSALPAGSVLWSVPEIPGCKNKQLIQAVPSADGPDLYVREECPQGTLIRALTADGRELWRRLLGGSDNSLRSDLVSRQRDAVGEHLGSHAPSVCDAISVGMTRDDALKTVNEHNVHLNPRQSQSDVWALEEKGFRCTISFDGKTGSVIKKKKIIVTD